MQKGIRSTRRAFSTKELIFIIAMVVLLLGSATITAQLVNFNIASQSANFFLSLGTLTFTALLYFFCVNSFALSKREKFIFEFMVSVFFILALLLLFSIGIEGKQEMSGLSMLLNTLFYLCSALYWVMFWHFQKGKYSHPLGQKCCKIIYYSFFGIYSLLTLINHFTGFCFSVEPDGTFVIHSFLLFDLTFLWFAIYLVIAVTTKCNLKTKLTLASYPFFPMLNWISVFIIQNTEFYINIFSAIGIFLYLIPLYLLFFNVYLENGRIYLQREHELEESRANALMLKINPHFIANTMSSIVALCDTEPQTAGKLASQFAHYLRDNYANISTNPLIPFSKELEHIRNYLAVEQIRFTGLKIKYDIQSDNFLLPSLAIQPLVENAVRHGISKRPNASGTITIQSVEDVNDYVIRIIDDGVGFRTVATDDNKKHIGIANAKTRLSLLCNGTLTITSQPNQYTVCEIKIPKGE